MDIRYGKFVIARSDSDEAIQRFFLDCFASLAMTLRVTSSAGSRFPSR
jgi:hypothetical protein